MFIFAFGIVTLGLGFALYWLLPPATVIWALFYFGFTLGGRASATIGMRVMDIEMRTWYGAPGLFRARRRARHRLLVHRVVVHAVHAAGCFFNERRRLLHDILLGTVVINNRARASVLRGRPMPTSADRTSFDGSAPGARC